MTFWYVYCVYGSIITHSSAFTLTSSSSTYLSIYLHIHLSLCAGEIAAFIKEVNGADRSYISIKLDMLLIQKFHLNINAHTVRDAILYSVGRSPALKALKEKNVEVKYGCKYNNRLHVYPPEGGKDKDSHGSHQRIYFIIQVKARIRHIYEE